MKTSGKKALALFVLIVLSVGLINAQEESNLKLWYEKPASQWVEALPVGNGRLGAMVFGNPARLKGWVCACGNRLNLAADEKSEENATCSKCSRNYSKKGNIVEQI